MMQISSTVPVTIRSLLAGGLIAFGLTQTARALEVLTSENPPFSYQDSAGNLVGMSADVVAEIGRRAKVHLNITNRLPWVRSYRLVQLEQDTCAFSVSRLPEREALFSWVGPIATNKWALFARHNFESPIGSLEDAKKYRIGGLLEDAKAAYLEARGFKVDTVPSDKLNPAKLAAGHIDLWVTGLYTAKETASAAGVHGIKSVLVFNEVDSYLVCNPKTSPETMERLRIALEQLRKEGFVQRVQARYNSQFVP
jgi:polar amino acid transport system substrate-binding protein